MNENAEKWVAALESGEYQQTNCRLRAGNSFCCLGVACDVAVKAGVPIEVEPPEDSEGLWHYDGVDGVLPEAVQNWLGLASEMGSYRRRRTRSLSDDNDRGASFAEIAQTIRTHPELFVDES